MSGPSRTAAPAAARPASRSGPSCSCRPARAPLPRGSFPGPSLAAFAFAAASPSSQAPGSASPCPPWAQRQPRCAGKPPRLHGALRESDAARDPGACAPFPRSPAASALRALLRSCANPAECAQRRSQRPRREVWPSVVRAPLRSQPLPATPHPPCRRPQCPAPRRARPRVSGPGRGLTRYGAGHGGRGRGHGAQRGGTPPLCRRGRVGAYQRGPSKNVVSRAPKNQSAEKRSSPNLLPKNKENKLSCLS